MRRLMTGCMAGCHLNRHVLAFLGYPGVVSRLAPPPLIAHFRITDHMSRAPETIAVLPLQANQDTGDDAGQQMRPDAGGESTFLRPAVRTAAHFNHIVVRPSTCLVHLACLLGFGSIFPHVSTAAVKITGCCISCSYTFLILCSLRFSAWFLDSGSGESCM